MNKKLLFHIAFTFLLFTLVNIWVIQFFDLNNFPIRRSVTFDEYIRTDYLERIESEKPEIVAIGDSAIRQLDDAVFSEISGYKSLFFSAPGSGSAYWYLFIRNEILRARHYPKYVLVFFRGTTLTAPEYRVTGNYFIRLEEIAAPKDADVFDKAINSRKNQWMLMLEKYIPIFTYRSEIYSNIVQDFRNYLPEKILNSEVNTIDQAYDEIFDDAQINDLLWEEYFLNIDAVLYQPKALNFIARVDRSFLPNMMQDLRAVEITPVFVRVKYRTHAEGKKDSPALISYLGELEAYIEENGGIYVDLAQVETLSTEMFRDNFHIDADYAGTATGIIAIEITTHLN